MTVKRGGGQGEGPGACGAVRCGAGARRARAVGAPHPVADRDAERVDVGHVQLADVALRHPRLPVPAQLLVALLRAEGGAKSVCVHADVLRRVLLVALGGAEELVEEGGRDPRLEHQPTGARWRRHGIRAEPPGRRGGNGGKGWQRPHAAGTRGEAAWRWRRARTRVDGSCQSEDTTVQPPCLHLPPMLHAAASCRDAAMAHAGAAGITSIAHPPMLTPRICF